MSEDNLIAAVNEKPVATTYTSINDKTQDFAAVQELGFDGFIDPDNSDVIGVKINGGTMFMSRHGPMPQIMKTIHKLAPYKIGVLIKGETGTGKEYIAHYLHQHSDRKNKPFIVIDCAKVPEHLIESELFGHVKGAFTGADKDRVGKFEIADGGTIFLDEIDKMPKPAQAKLLTALQKGIFERVGSNTVLHTDVRVIGAFGKLQIKNPTTGRKEDTVADDLFYRLGSMIKLPPLRERQGDMELLAKHFATKAAKELGLKTNPVLAPETLIALKAHDWRGNIRELQAAMTTAAVLAEQEGMIKPEHLMLRKRSLSKNPDKPVSFLNRIGKGREIEDILKDMLDLFPKHDGSVSILGISQEVGINRSTLSAFFSKGEARLEVPIVLRRYADKHGKVDAFDALLLELLDVKGKLRDQIRSR